MIYFAHARALLTRTPSPLSLLPLKMIDEPLPLASALASRAHHASRLGGSARHRRRRRRRRGLRDVDQAAEAFAHEIVVELRGGSCGSQKHG